MMLIEVLDKFTTEINERIESIKYDDDDTTFEIAASFQDNDDTNEWQYASIILFASGESMLYVKGDGIDGEPTAWVWDKVVDFYTEVRNIWKNVV